MIQFDVWYTNFTKKNFLVSKSHFCWQVGKVPISLPEVGRIQGNKNILHKCKKSIKLQAVVCVIFNVINIVVFWFPHLFLNCQIVITYFVISTLKSHCTFMHILYHVLRGILLNFLFCILNCLNLLSYRVRYYLSFVH